MRTRGKGPRAESGWTGRGGGKPRAKPSAWTAYRRTAPSSRRCSGHRVVVETPSGRRTVGRVVLENGHSVFRKTVSRSRHLLKVLDAWGLSCEALARLEREGVREVVVFDREDRITYRTNLATLRSCGIVRGFPGCDVQTFLPRALWERSDARQGRLPLEMPA